jgi:HAD superfamily hydrolase (TIGR01509 family)
MRLHYFLNISLLLIIVCTSPYFAPSFAKSSGGHGEATKDRPKKVIIFDLMNVIIKENQAGFTKKIGYGNIASYMITHFKHPGYRCLDMLDAMSKHETQKPHIQLTLRKRTMPRCLVELQEGKKTALQIKDEILKTIELLDQEKHFNSAKEKALMIKIINTILDPEVTASMIEPIKSTIQLIQKLKSAGHNIYIFANAPSELYTAFKKKYPDIINLFDGIIISSEIKTVKPSLVIFNHLLTAHNLIPENCILIDDLQETVVAAQKLGLQAFVYDKNIANKIKRCGIKI